eukprot:365733-Chlamydomonas_euryale.AAC.34
MASCPSHCTRTQRSAWRTAMNGCAAGCRADRASGTLHAAVTSCAAAKIIMTYDTSVPQKLGDLVWGGWGNLRSPFCVLWHQLPLA